MACLSDPEKAPVHIRVKEYAKIAKNYDALKASIATYGPANIAVDATQWKLYTGGIMDSAACKFKGNNHEVVACGYGKDYIKYKNSWGDEWGEEGFIRLSTNTSGNKGTCGELSDATEVREVEYIDNE